MFASRGVLVIGGGIAGQAVCEALRAHDADIPITLVCGEPERPYDRVRLGSLLTGEEDVGALRLRPDAWYEDSRIRVLEGRRVTGLDPEGGTATVADGTVLHFDGSAWQARQVTTDRDVDLVAADGSRTTVLATGVDIETGALLADGRPVLVGEIAHVRLGPPVVVETGV